MRQIILERRKTRPYIFKRPPKRAVQCLALRLAYAVTMFLRSDYNQYCQGNEMGFCISWIARRGSSIDELLRMSGRSVTGECHEFLDIGWYLLELSHGRETPWVLLIADGAENYADLSTTHAATISNSGCETVYFQCSDIVMASELGWFKDGVEAWSIRYDCADSSMQPAVNGEVPSVANNLLEDFRKKQPLDDSTDYLYEIAGELGHHFVGFRHDIDVKAREFRRLSNLDKQRPAWWQFWQR